jgi:enediyne biosynthesis protein E3
VVLQEKTIGVMETHSDVLHQMEKIKDIFQHALYISTEHQDRELATYLKTVDLEFRAVAYEGIAMGLALTDLETGTLQQWRSFTRTSSAVYLPHIHVGLGWAVAKQRVPSLAFIDPLDPIMQFRVADGCGYYDGTFRKLQTITKKERSNAIEPKDFQAYDQGVGRSLWYLYKGNNDLVNSAIQQFADARRADLWRGVGIACSFVGGCDERSLRDLQDLAASDKRQLAIGAAFTARARIQTNSVTNSSKLACRVWGNLSVERAMQLTEATQPSATGAGDEVYKIWVSQLESELQLS